MAAPAPPLPVTVNWASSGVGGQVAGTPRHNRILELHRLHFVHKKGHNAVKETIEAKCKEGRSADAKAAKEHNEKLQQLKDKMDHKVKHALAYGSMSLWTKEERDKIEDARHDPVEAKDRMTKHSRELGSAFEEQKRVMSDRVKAAPSMNIRPKDEREMIEAARQDPQEAKERIEAHMKACKQTFVEQRKEMQARVKATPSASFRTKEEWAAIEELRHDPEEAKLAMAQHMKQLDKNYQEEKTAMTERVWSRSCESQWTKEQWAEIEDKRQDPQEAQQKAKAHMKNLSQSYKDHKEDLTARVKAKPPLNIRTKEERVRIEEQRQDPNEARETAKAHMKELHQTYQEHKRHIHERVHTNPLVTFRSPRAQETVAKKILKNMPLK